MRLISRAIRPEVVVAAMNSARHKDTAWRRLIPLAVAVAIAIGFLPLSLSQRDSSLATEASELSRLRVELATERQRATTLKGIRKVARRTSNGVAMQIMTALMNMALQRRPNALDSSGQFCPSVRLSV